MIPGSSLTTYLLYFVVLLNNKIQCDEGFCGSVWEPLVKVLERLWSDAWVVACWFLLNNSSRHLEQKKCNYHKLQDTYGKTNQPSRMIILRSSSFCLGCECKEKENQWQRVRSVMEDGERESWTVVLMVQSDQRVNRLASLSAPLSFFLLLSAVFFSFISVSSHTQVLSVQRAALAEKSRTEAER